MDEASVGSEITTNAARQSAGLDGLRYVAAALALASAGMYVMVALEVVNVSSTAGKESPFVPMAGAAAAFVVGAMLVALRPGRIVFGLGVLVQLVVIVGYFAIAPSRDPHVEAFGLAMKALQLVLLGLLAYLTVKAPARTRATRR